MAESVWIMITLPTSQIPDNPESMQTSGDFASNNKGKQENASKDCHFVSIPSMKSMLEKSLEELDINNAVWIKTSDDFYYHVYFICDVDKSDEVIQYIHEQGVGVVPKTFIGIIPFSLAYINEDENEIAYTLVGDGEEEKKAATKQSGFKAMQEKFLKSVTARLTVAQVVASVQAGAELTFDFVSMILCASWLAATGLLESDVVTLVASMLVSPLMGPIMAMTFGLIVRDRKLRNLAVRNASFGFIASITFGFFYGLIILSFPEQYKASSVWPSSYMRARGELRSLWLGAIIALPSGAGVALSILSGNQSSLVGVAISASLLPPCVNTGLLWSLAFLRSIRAFFENSQPVFVGMGNFTSQIMMKPSLTHNKDYEYSYSINLAYECLILGAVSFGLAMVNVLCILVMSWILLKIKEVTPSNKIPSPQSRFWTEDVKIARDYNTHSQRRETLPHELLQEWAQIAGLNPEEILSQDPSAQMAQIHTLKDLIKDVEEDEIFQQIYANTRPEADIVRKMSLLPGQGLDGHRFQENFAMSDLEFGRSRQKSIAIPDGSRRSLRSPRNSTERLKRGSINPISNSWDSDFLHRRRRSSVLTRRSLRNYEPGGKSLSVWPRRGSEMRSGLDVQRRGRKNPQNIGENPDIIEGP
ncbi:uncharacterized protein LOC141855680 [Brevipalpus obovatus]|uniref:uncharacterized protein LOC141855680 n=1 Tax=Brevipalpus obovatus TaxID=246614 RepID=UPI003D9F6B1F